MENITIDDKYAVINSSSSKGVRKKFYIPGTNTWYKEDRGVEEQISNLLEYSSLIDFVKYTSLIVNGKKACSSKGFISSGEEEITFARIVEHMTGSKVGDFIFRQSEIKGRFNSVVQLVEKYTGINTSLYIRTLLYLDMLIANPDRHFNNMAMIYNIQSETYYPAPVFDNGAALSVENSEMCGNFGGKHEYVLSSIGKINSPIRFDYDKISECSPFLKERLERYEDIFRYTGKSDIKTFGRRLQQLPYYVTCKDDVDYVELVESKYPMSERVNSFMPENEKQRVTPLGMTKGFYEYNGRSIRLTEVARETGINVNDLKYEMKKFGYKEAFDAAYLGTSVRKLRKPYILSDGTSLTKEEVCARFNVDLKWLLKLEDKRGVEYIQKHISDGDLLTYDDSKPNYLSIPGYKFTKNELAYLLNIKPEQVESYKSNLQKLLQMYHFTERLTFKDKAHNATWVSEDAWKYVCPKCGRKLLLTTEEIKIHLHSDKYCSDNEV